MVEIWHEGGVIGHTEDMLVTASEWEALDKEVPRPRYPIRLRKATPEDIKAYLDSQRARTFAGG